MVSLFCVVPSVIAFFEGFKHGGQHVVRHCLRQIQFRNPLVVSNAPISNHVYYISRPINKYKIDIVRKICVLAFGKYIIYYNPTTGSIYLDRVKCSEETAKSAVFKMADLNM